MNCGRRTFIRVGAAGIAGGIALYAMGILQRTAISSDRIMGAVGPLTDPTGEEWVRRYWGFIVDNEKCIGCGRCVVACKMENKVPWKGEYNRTWVERYTVKEDGETIVDSPEAGRDGFGGEFRGVGVDAAEIRTSFFVPKLCNQCDKPPCVTVCPVGATYITGDGVILVDQQHCIGCKYCIQACPYGARYVLPPEAAVSFGQTSVVDKCTWCYHRITKGLPPACVEVCPVGARQFGDMRDPESSVRKTLREKRVYVLKPDLGTEPKVYYVGFEKGVH